MTYQNLLIANFREGKRQDVEPWLLPNEAFEQMIDGYVDNGVIRKRNGYVEFDKFPEAVVHVSGITQASEAVVTTSSAHGLSDGDRVRLCNIQGMTEVNGTTYVISDAGASTFKLKTLAGAYANSSGWTAFSASPSGVVCIFSSKAIMGIMQYIDSSGVEQLIVANTVRLAKYNTTGAYLDAVTKYGTVVAIGDGSTTAFNVTITLPGTVQSIANSITLSGTVSAATVTATNTTDVTNPYSLTGAAGTGSFNGSTGALTFTFGTAPDASSPITINYELVSDIFTGDEEDYFNWDNYNSKVWFTNGIDKIYYYDGTAVYEALIDPVNQYGVYSTTNKVVTCKSIKNSRERLILFDTKEGSVRYPQRVRWSQAGQVFKWAQLPGQGNWIDTSTGDFFQYAQYLKTAIVIAFQRSFWILQYTNDPGLTFRLDRLTASSKTDCPYAGVSFDDFVVGMGTESIYAVDGAKIKDIDDNIPDETLEMNQNYLQINFAHRWQYRDQLLIAYLDDDFDYVGGADTRKNTILVWNYKDNAWSQFRLPISCIGEFYTVTSKTMASFPGITMQDLGGRMSDYIYQSKAPILLGGANDYGPAKGRVWQLDTGTIDYLSTLQAVVSTATQTQICTVTTVVAHELATNDYIFISGVSGLEDADGNSLVEDRFFKVTVSNTTQFTIDLGEIPSTAYSSGGNIYLGAPIEMNLKSAEWNPGNTDGKNTRLGWIDFYVDTDPDDEVYVDFRVNADNPSYQSKALSFDGTGNKTWKRLTSGAIGNTHSIEIRDTSTKGESIGIHAIRLAVETVGRAIS